MREVLLIEKRDGIPCVIIFPWSEYKNLIKIHLVILTV